VRPRLNKLARTIYVKTQFLMCNTTSLVLLVRQKGSSDVLAVDPQGRQPFSWHARSTSRTRKIEVRVANGSWSQPLSISLKSVSLLRTELDALGIAYELLMEVRAPDEFSRIILFSTRLHFANQTCHRLIVRTGSNHQCATIEAHSRADSALYATRLFLSMLPPSTPASSSVASPLFSFESFALSDDTASNTVQLCPSSQKHEPLAIDITIKLEENGMCDSFRFSFLYAAGGLT